MVLPPQLKQRYYSLTLQILLTFIGFGHHGEPTPERYAASVTGGLLRPQWSLVVPTVPVGPPWSPMVPHGPQRSPAAHGANPPK